MEQELLTNQSIIMYVDGSYTTNNPGIVGWGYCSSDKRLNGHGHFDAQDNPHDIISGRQIGGEVKATMEGILAAKKAGYVDIVICHDYEGIEKWAKGEWKRKKHYTQVYHSWIQGQMRQLTITFQKVASKDNIADEYARIDTGAPDAHKYDK